MQIRFVVVARPNFVKVAPIFWPADRYPELEMSVVHTGQHYDVSMSDAFFEDLRIPMPNHRMSIGGKDQAVQVAQGLLGLWSVFREKAPDWVVVVGDVNSTLAGALAARMVGCRVAHVEAGLRSGDWDMPEGSTGG